MSYDPSPDELFKARVEVALTAAKEMRDGTVDALRAVDRVLAIGATAAIGLSVLVLKDGIEWAALAGPVAWTAVTMYIIDLYTEAAYLGGCRRLQEERLGEMLGAEPGNWEWPTRWDTPMVWESRVAEVRVYSASRWGLVGSWLVVDGIAIVVAYNWAVGEISVGWVVAYTGVLVLLFLSLAVAAAGAMRASERAYVLASGRPLSNPPRRWLARLAGTFEHVTDDASPRWDRRSTRNAKGQATEGSE